jgi:hypothetical protein
MWCSSSKLARCKKSKGWWIDIYGFSMRLVEQMVWDGRVDEYFGYGWGEELTVCKRFSLIAFPFLIGGMNGLGLHDSET